MALDALRRMAEEWAAHPGRGVRVVCFGSSNTEMLWHSQGRHAWPEWLACGLRGWVGRQVTVINAGISGDTSADLLNRSERDVFPLSPTVVLITIGGNDAARLPIGEYRRNLATLVAAVRARGAEPVLQTYYAVLREQCDPVQAGNFPLYMQTCREIGEETSVPCIDQWGWFGPWYEAEPDAYRSIMLDALHLNPIGNCLMGILCIRAFGLPDPLLPEDIAGEVAAALTAMTGCAVAAGRELPPARPA